MATYSSLYDPKTPDPAYQLDAFGGMSAGSRARQGLLNDMRTPAMSALEVSTSKDRGRQQAAANMSGQAQNLSQAALMGGPLAAAVGRNANVQVQAAGQLGEAGALSSSESERIKQTVDEQKRQAIRGAMEREEDRERQDALNVADKTLETLGGGTEVAGKIIGMV